MAAELHHHLVGANHAQLVVVVVAHVQHTHRGHEQMRRAVEGRGRGGPAVSLVLLRSAHSRRSGG